MTNMLKLEKVFTDGSNAPLVGYLVQISTGDTNQPVQTYVKRGQVFRALVPAPQFYKTGADGKVTVWVPPGKYAMKLLHPTSLLVMKEDQSVSPSSEYVSTSELSSDEVEELRDILNAGAGVFTVNGKTGPNVVLTAGDVDAAALDDEVKATLLNGTEMFVITNQSSWTAGRGVIVKPANGDSVTVKQYQNVQGVAGGGVATTLGVFTSYTAMNVYLELTEAPITSLGFQRTSGAGTTSTYQVMAGLIAG